MIFLLEKNSPSRIFASLVPGPDYLQTQLLPSLSPQEWKSFLVPAHVQVNLDLFLFIVLNRKLASEKHLKVKAVLVVLFMFFASIAVFCIVVLHGTYSIKCCNGKI